MPGAGRAARAPCSTLLRVGFTEPTGSPRSLVRSYRTVSPLPVRTLAAAPSAVCSLWHCPAGHPDWPLASTLPCGVPTFLDPSPSGVIPGRHGPRPPGRLTVAPIVPQADRPGYVTRPPGTLRGPPGPPGFYPDPVSLESRARRLMADHGGPDALSVTELYDRVDRAVRAAFPEEVWVTGEVRS